MSESTGHRGETLSQPTNPALDRDLLEIGLRMTPAERLRWLEETVEELLPWLGLASRQQQTTP